MKKVFYIVSLIGIYCSCSDNSRTPDSVSDEDNAVLVTIIFKNEPHEFIRYIGQSHTTTIGIAHWPGYTYCNAQNPEGNSD